MAREVDTKFQNVNSQIGEVKKSIDETKQQTDEIRGRETRVNNVIMYRIPEKGTKEERVEKDESFCGELFNKVLGVKVPESDIKSVFRLRKRIENTNRPFAGSV